MARIGCMEQEGRFFSDLAKVARYRIAGDQPKLHNDSRPRIMLCAVVALR